MMKRQELEAEIGKLKSEMSMIEGAFDLICKYAFGKGTGGNAIALAISKIQSRIAEAERALALLHEELTIDELRRTYEYFGATNATTKDYIAALEKCRPWVIRDKDSGHHWEHLCWAELSGCAMFESREEAERYHKKLKCGPSWEVVQWEGEE